MLTDHQTELLNRCDTSKASVKITDRETGQSVQASVAGIGADELTPIGVRQAIATGKGGTISVYDVPHKASGLLAAQYAETLEPVGFTDETATVSACDNDAKMALERQRAEKKTAALVRQEAEILAAQKSIDASRKPKRKAATRKPKRKAATVKN